MKYNIVAILLLLLFGTSCGDFNKVLKSTDTEFKYEYAKKEFEKKNYYHAYTILEDLVAIYKGTDKAEESLYLLAQSYYGAKDYLTAASTFTTYYTTYQKGTYTELARFYAATSYYYEAPDPRLDQSQNEKAIAEFQMFLEYFPQSSKVEEAKAMMAELEEKLAYREYLNAKLYFDLGNYMGNNYLSCVIVSQNALRDYPFSKYKEDFYFLTLKAKYEQAVNSVPEKKMDRYRDVVDEYFSYKNEFPEGKYIKDATNFYKKAQKITKN